MTEHKETQESAPKMIRKKPPVFPTGFRFGNINDESYIIDFVDATQDGDATIFSSIVLSRTTAAQLFKGLQGFMGNEKDQA